MPASGSNPAESARDAPPVSVRGPPDAGRVEPGDASQGTKDAVVDEMLGRNRAVYLRLSKI